MPWHDAHYNPSLTPAGILPLAGANPPGITREYIPGGQAGTAATIYRMQQLVEIGRRDPCVKNVVGQAIRRCPQKDFACYARAIYDWMLRNVRYVYDPNEVEEIEHPCYTLTTSKVGDCDSLAVALASMYERIDLPARFTTVKADMTQPNEYSHVFVEVNIPGQGWTGADVTMPSKRFGWVPQKHFPRKHWPATLTRRAGPREDKLDGLRGTSDMHVCSSCLGALALSPVPEQPSRGEEGYADFHQDAADTGGIVAPPLPPATDYSKWLLYGGIALGAMFLLKKGR